MSHKAYSFVAVMRFTLIKLLDLLRSRAKEGLLSFGALLKLDCPCMRGVQMRRSLLARLSLLSARATYLAVAG